MITDFYWPFVGGVEQHVRRLGQALTTRGHEVAVATLAADGLAPFEPDGRVRVYRLRGTLQRAAWLFANRARAWAPPFPDPEVMAGLRHILRREMPDIVHGHDWLARAFVPFKRAGGPKLVMSLHYYTLACAKKSLMRQGAPCAGPGFRKCLGCAGEHYGPLKGAGVALANWSLGALECRRVDMFLPVSRAAASANGLAPGPRCQIIPNFMPEQGSGQGEAAAAAGPYVSQLPDGPFLLYVGDLRREKGIEVLLAAYAGLEHAPPLVLIGKVWADTPQAFPPNVRVFRNWPNEAVLEAWKRCHVAVVPSVWPEPFGIVVIEAMAAGRPIIASRIGGIPDILDDGRAGWLVPPGDPEALRRALGRLLREPALREDLGRAAGRRAAAYQAAAVVPQVERVYAGLLRQTDETHEPAAAGEHHYQQL
jgi:glycosyltransferase involved in cell wall biosynthesis